MVYNKYIACDYQDDIMRRIFMGYAHCQVFGADTIEYTNPGIITPSYTDSLCFIPDIFWGKSPREEVIS